MTTDYALQLHWRFELIISGRGLRYEIIQCCFTLGMYLEAMYRCRTALVNYRII